jgi:hypothetical protein
VFRNFYEKRLIGTVFLDVAKAFDMVCVHGVLYKRLSLFSMAYFV